MKRWLKRIGLGLATLLVTFAGLAWYLSGLPWRNSCSNPTAFAPPSRHQNSAIATSQPLATQAGADVLTDGGNAADAAVAIALMLGVVEPGNSGLGGGGFAMVHDPKTDHDVALDFRERAPLGLDVKELHVRAATDPTLLHDGPVAVAVPAEWSGLLELHRRYGRLPLSRLARPAIEAARAGAAIGTEQVARCWVRFSKLRNDANARRIFLNSVGLCPLPGSTRKNPELGDTIAALTDDAHPRSWDDVVGKKMVAFLVAKGSRISERDLEAVNVVERPVVEGHFDGKRIVSMGPPSSGGILVIALLQTYERLRQRLPNANWLHLWTEASRLTFYDRARLLGDPDFVSVPVEHLISDDYATAQAARVAEKDALVLPKDASDTEGTHTTHFSVIDKDGLAVAVTQTINVPFGAGLVVPETGVLLNDEMDDFYFEGPNAFGLVGNDRNAPAPGKRPLSSMSPTFVFDGSNLVAVLGSPGGSNIPTAVAWVIREMVEGKKSGDEAVRSPRVHDQWVPNVLQVEPRFDRSTLPPDLVAIAKKPPFPVGRVQMVELEPSGWHGVSDCRDEGVPWSGAL